MAKVMYGLTHNLEGQPIIREQRTVKVGIGLAKGKDLHVWIDANGHWCVRSGKETQWLETVEAAKQAYRNAKQSAPERRYPERIPYFTFTRVSSDGIFEPDFEAIETHGPIPTEIDVVFLKDEPFDYAYQMWTATELKCSGNGKDAERVLSMARTPEEQLLAEDAAVEGKKYFPIVDGCWTQGCPYSKAIDDRTPAPCKPHGRLVFQLLKSPRLGGTAYFETTGFRSVSQIFSSIQIFREVSGRGNPENGFVAGIPLKMVLQPYKVVHNGRAGTQYGVSLQFRAADAVALKRDLIAHVADYRTASDHLLLNASSAEAIDITNAIEIDEDLETSPPQNAAAIEAEFYPSETNPEDGLEGDAAAEFDAMVPDQSGSSVLSGGVRMPQRKQAPATQNGNGATSAQLLFEGAASEAASATAHGEKAETSNGAGELKAGYLESLKREQWTCMSSQKDILMRKVTELLDQGGTPDQIRAIAREVASVDNLAQLPRDKVGLAMVAFRKAIEKTSAQAAG